MQCSFRPRLHTGRYTAVLQIPYRCKPSVPPYNDYLAFKITFFLFQYIWRVPVNEIDRPGSFCFHNNQSTVLLLHVLFELKDYQLLLHVSTFLNKTPDKERFVVIKTLFS